MGNFRVEKSLRPVIFSTDISMRPVNFSSMKSICPVIFSIKKSVRPVVFFIKKSTRPVIFFIEKSIRPVILQIISKKYQISVASHIRYQGSPFQQAGRDFVGEHLCKNEIPRLSIEHKFNPPKCMGLWLEFYQNNISTLNV